MIEIEEKNPLKQGLKHSHAPLDTDAGHNIEEKNPLKQGLKPIQIELINQVRYN